jgi:hypothetical protein
MNHYDPILNMYADSGLRTEQDWASRGRIIKPDVKPTTTAVSRRQVVELYSRPQTDIRRSTRY